MNDKNTNPFASWRIQHPSGTLDAKTEIEISRWLHVSHALLDLFNVFEDEIEPWLKGRKSSEPNLVAFIAGYGYSRTATGDWKSLPIEIPDVEVEDWEHYSSLVGSINQLHDYQAGVAGSVPEILHARQDDAIKLIEKQLKKLYAELDLLVARPIADFTPTQWEDEAIGDEAVGWEVSDLDRIFDVYEELWCFEQGIEELRMLMITEDDPEFHLPNQGFYDALVSIDSHKLLSVLDAAEPKLKQVLQLWSSTTMVYSGKPYHRPYDDTAPDVFWWRHRNVRKQARSQSAGRPSRGNQRGKNQHRRPGSK